MPPLNGLSLPFLTRKMLGFEYAMAFTLRVDVQADEAVTLNLRGMTREATFEYKVTTPSDSTISTQSFALSDIPIMVTIEDTARALEQGQCFVSISLVANGVIIQQLTSGYIYAQKALSWPNTQQVDLRPGGGRIQRKLPATPTGSNDIELAVTPGEIWKIRDIAYLITTDGTAANRRARILISTIADATLAMWSDTDQVASTTRIYHAGNIGTGNAGAVGSDIFIPIPSDMILTTGDTLFLGAQNKRAGDRMIPTDITIEKYFTTP